MLDSGFCMAAALMKLGTCMVARVGEAIKEEMVLERMEEDKKDEEERKRQKVFGFAR